MLTDRFSMLIQMTWDPEGYISDWVKKINLKMTKVGGQVPRASVKLVSEENESKND